MIRNHPVLCFASALHCCRAVPSSRITLAVAVSMSTAAPEAAAPPARPGNFVFVYGSLRPDDDSGMPWTKSAVRGLTAQRATLLRAQLYQDAYARAVLLLPPQQQQQDDGPNGTTASSSPTTAENNNESVVHGWVLSTSDPRLFQERMALFDEIEGVSKGFYQKDRAVARLRSPEDCILAGGGGDRPLGQTGELLQVYCYHRTDPIDENVPSIWIESGDWIDRKRN